MHIFQLTNNTTMKYKVEMTHMNIKVMADNKVKITYMNITVMADNKVIN